MAAKSTALRTETELASNAQAAAALANLSVADLARLNRLARARSLSLEGMEWRDLLHEAVSRMLSGTRRWPHDVPLVAFLAQAMRSIAGEQRRHETQRADRVSLEDAPAAIADSRANPDRAIETRQRLNLVLKHFAHDDEVSILISGLERGETAVETIRRTNLDSKRFDAARKRLRRTVNRLMDEGRL